MQQRILNRRAAMRHGSQHIIFSHCDGCPAHWVDRPIWHLPDFTDYQCEPEHGCKFPISKVILNKNKKTKSKKTTATFKKNYFRFCVLMCIDGPSVFVLLILKEYIRKVSTPPGETQNMANFNVFLVPLCFSSSSLPHPDRCSTHPNTWSS